MTTQRLVTLLGKVTDIYHFASPLTGEPWATSSPALLPNPKPQTPDHTNESSDATHSVHFGNRSAHCFWAAAHRGVNTEDATPFSRTRRPFSG